MPNDANLHPYTQFPVCWASKRLCPFLSLDYPAFPVGRVESRDRAKRGRGHCIGMYGQLNEPPLSSMSRMSVSIGVLPTSRTKKSCSMTWADTVRRDGSRSSSLPKRVGWAGYCVRTYSSSAHWDFSCRFSMWAASDRPHASTHARIVLYTELYSPFLVAKKNYNSKIHIHLA